MKNLSDMMAVKKSLYMACLFILSLTAIQGQAVEGQYPEIEKPIPDFTLNDLYQYPSRQVTSEDLKGKFVVLYFWSRFCAGTVKGLSRVSALSDLFKGKAEIILVGGEPLGTGDRYMLPGHESGMEALKALYKRLNKTWDMKAPAAFDPELFQRFAPGGYVPHVIWIDPNGIVKAITNTLDKETLEYFINGKPFEYHDTSYKAQQYRKEHPYDINTPYLVDHNGGAGSGFMYRSLLSGFKHDVPGIPLSLAETCQDDGYIPKGRVEGYATLEQLYKLAYQGYMAVPLGMDRDSGGTPDYNHIVLEVKDSTPFTGYDYKKGTHVYVYSMIVPPDKATPEYLMQVLQGDLKNYFGYQARVEVRSLPYWSVGLSAKAKARLKTKGNDYSYSGDNFTRIGYNNVSVDSFLESLFYLVGSGVKLPIVNDTGMEEHIDIPETNLLWSDFTHIKRFLTAQGFTFEKKEKPFRVVVISDENIKDN